MCRPNRRPKATTAFSRHQAVPRNSGPVWPTGRVAADQAGTYRAQPGQEPVTLRNWRWSTQRIRNRSAEQTSSPTRCLRRAGCPTCVRPDRPSAGLIGDVPMVVVVRMVICGGPALTGRISRHSTAGLAVVAAATLMVAQLDQGVGRSHPQLGSERGIAGGPVGKQGPGAWMRPWVVPGLWHNANSTANTIIAPVMIRLDQPGQCAAALALPGWSAAAVTIIPGVVRIARRGVRIRRSAWHGRSSGSPGADLLSSIWASRVCACR